MKKFCTALVAILLVCTFLITGCTSKELTKVKVCEVTHSIFYAPQYVAIAKGYFADEGIEIELTNGGGADNVMAAVLSGDADIGLCGPEASVYVYNQGQEDYAINFAQLTQRDGSFLLAREPNPNFKISDLEGKYIVGGRAGGMPEMTLEYVLKQNGLIPGKNVTVDTSIAFNAMSGGFVGGVGDYVALFEPNATALENEGVGYVVMSIGEMSGSVPYTAYNAKKSFIENNEDLIKGFTKAIQRGQDFVASHSAKEVAEVIAEFFADTNMDDLIKVVQRYQDIQAYATTTKFTEESFERLLDIMESAGVLDSRPPFDALVTNKYAK